VLTHRILLADFYLAEPTEKPVLPADYIWVNEQDIDDYALPRLIERLLEKLPATKNDLE
jgi:A/G-specific adenine glycosylase